MADEWCFPRGAADRLRARGGFPPPHPADPRRRAERRQRRTDVGQRDAGSRGGGWARLLVHFEFEAVNSFSKIWRLSGAEWFRGLGSALVIVVWVPDERLRGCRAR